MSSPSISKMMPPQAESVAQLMAQTMSCMFAIVLHKLLDDEVVESDDLDEQCT